MRAPVFALLALVLLAPSAAATSVLYSEDFEGFGGFPGVALPSGWSASAGSLWHVGSCATFSPTHALQFNQPSTCNYDVNDRVFGTVTSRAYALPATSDPLALVFMSRASTEFPESGYGCTELDAMMAEISNDAGATWTKLYDECDQDAWNMRNFDISAYAGETIQIRWGFESGDEVANNYGGWAIDDVQIAQLEPTAPVPELPTVFLAIAGIAGIVALAAHRRKD